MIDKKLAYNMQVTCEDGTSLEGVEYWIKDDKLIYKDANGEILEGAKEPKSFLSGKSDFSVVEVMLDVQAIKGPFES